MAFDPIRHRQELHAFHTIDRKAHNRLMNLGFQPDVSKKIIAFWLWLEEKYLNFVPNALTLDHLTLRRLAFETITCLQTLNYGLFFAFNASIPTMSSFVGEPISWGWIYQNKESAEMAMSLFMSNVCDQALDDAVPVTSRNGAQFFLPVSHFFTPSFWELPQEHIAARGQVNQEHHEAQGQVNQDPVRRQQNEEYYIGQQGKDLLDCIPKDLL